MARQRGTFIRASCAAHIGMRIVPIMIIFYWNADGTYEGWWGYENHPKLNVEGCAALREELLAIARRGFSRRLMRMAGGWMLPRYLGKTRGIQPCLLADVPHCGQERFFR